MAERIPQSVAIRVPLQAYLASDHVSPATGLTIAITISKNGGVYGNPSAGATNAQEIGNGSYYVDLSTTDTQFVGPLFVRGAVATMDPITAIYDVAAFADQTGDSFARIGAAGAGLTALGDTRLANLDVNVGSRSSHSAADVWSVGTRTLTSFGTLAADVATAVWGAGTRSLTTFGTLAADAATAVWGALSRTITGTVTLDATQGSYAPAKAGDAMTLTTAYDAAKSAASQTSVDDLPTNSELAAATLNADVKKVNGTPITGSGTLLDPWGP